ncbi:AB1gp14 [Acinetobacter phage AB1]|uniref:AB1gp14 n=1 Tax=Acinetobacter phage AB1 TaxID=889876 RepID=E2GLV2_9CAUD|nr:AB1gp14 [Acinetobacter phage AB1]ADO14385.1 AB1gp14 [Acinetobacter phage AB1]
MSYEQFKAQLILNYIKDNGECPSDEVLVEIKKLADFAYLGD